MAKDKVRRVKLECCGNELDEKRYYADGGFAHPGFEYYVYHFIDGGRIKLNNFNNGLAYKGDCPFCIKPVRFQYGRLITKENKYNG
jgi:hypothetical protein